MTLASDKDAEQTGYSVPPVLRAIALLRYIGAGNRCRNISSASKELGINRTTLIRLIHTLEDERMIEEIDEGAGYRLGTGLIALASEAIADRDVVQVARPILADLAAELNLSAHLGILDGLEIVYLARETPNSYLVSNVRVGTRLPAHATTIGRILLSELAPEALHKLYDHVKLDAYTDKTRTSLEELEAQLAEDRKGRIAWSVANFEPGIGSCAVAVYDDRGRAVGGINVTGQDSVFTPGTDEANVIERAIKSAANRISEGLGHTSRIARRA